MRIHCLVENSARRSSPFWGEHGVAFYIDAPGGNVLFDTGQSGAVLLHNAALLNLDLGAVEALALSHAHYDHTGGLPAALDHLPGGLPLFANADLFRPRYSQRADGEPRFIGIETARDELAAHCEFHLDDAPQEMVPGVWTAGAVIERPSFEGRSAQHVVAAESGGWLPDPYQDDLSLVLAADDGLVVLCGCCHAGLLNTLAHVRAHFPARPIIAVIGGTHLATADNESLAVAAAALHDEYGTPRLFLNHCTGERAYAALVAAFGHDVVQLCPAGTTQMF